VLCLINQFHAFFAIPEEFLPLTAKNRGRQQNDNKWETKNLKRMTKISGKRIEDMLDSISAIPH
jgi:hypothetical protein